jgi:hypothetical protein
MSIRRKLVNDFASGEISALPRSHLQRRSIYTTLSALRASLTVPNVDELPASLRWVVEGIELLRRSFGGLASGTNVLWRALAETPAFLPLVVGFPSLHLGF